MCDELMELTDKKFLSTPSARRATCSRRSRKHSRQILSTPSARRATRLRPRAAFCAKILSTPSARRATHCGVAGRCAPHYFIHALREEGDHEPTAADLHRIHISIHALREGRLLGPVAPGRTKKLYPRPPRGGRRSNNPDDGQRTDYFYPRPPREGDAVTIPMTGNAPIISIHALREEGDGLPVAHPLDVVRISIHALREEGDVILHEAQIADAQFLSTPSARRATRSPGRTRPSV